MAKDKPTSLEELAEFYRSEIKPEFVNINDRLLKLETGQAHLKDDIKGLKAELSKTISRREFEDLKLEVRSVKQTN